MGRAAASTKPVLRVFASEGDRIRSAANTMRAVGLMEIATRYDNLALAHDLKDERDSRCHDSQLVTGTANPQRI